MNVSYFDDRFPKGRCEAEKSEVSLRSVDPDGMVRGLVLGYVKREPFKIEWVWSYLMDDENFFFSWFLGW